MRQLMGLLKTIRIRNTTKEYYHLKFFASLHKAEMVPLEEVLGIEYKKETEESFDSQTDAEFERVALQKLEERKKQLNV